VEQLKLSEAPARRDSLESTLRLCLIPGIGPRTRRALIERFGCAEEVFRAAATELTAVDGVGRELCRRIVTAESAIDVRREIDLCGHAQIQILTETDAGYPRLLRDIYDPPGVLFCQGHLRNEDQLAVAIVGTRHATHYGRRQAEMLASGLARTGITVVSGLARGIDAVAHRAALEAGGRTIAVLGSGLLNIYPPEHVQLADKIARQGVLLSELPPEMAPMSGTFPQRNRLISGLSLGVVVVEAAARSGALITASHAAEQGRDVFAVPGPIDSRTSRGCHQLIRDGARLVESIDDVLDELGPLVEAMPRPDGGEVRHPAELQLNDQERRVLDAIDVQPTDIDSIVERSDLTISRVLSTISVLEIRRLIRRVSGSTVVRV
jgi:DNA processing protein